MASTCHFMAGSKRQGIEPRPRTSYLNFRESLGLGGWQHQQSTWSGVQHCLQQWQIEIVTYELKAINQNLWTTLAAVHVSQIIQKSCFHWSYTTFIQPSINKKTPSVWRKPALAKRSLDSATKVSPLGRGIRWAEHFDLRQFKNTHLYGIFKYIYIYLHSANFCVFW